MLYDITLRDLSVEGADIGVCLKLYGCRKFQIGAKIKAPVSFLDYMMVGKAAGYAFISAGHIPTINAVEAPDYVKSVLADADSMELRQDDPMYRVANEYDSHQFMREAIRAAIIRERRRSDAELQNFRANLCMLSLWLAVHDPDFANAMRQRMLDSFRIFRRAVLTVASSKLLAYVRNIGPAVIDLSEALREADKSDRSFVFTNSIVAGVKGTKK